MLDRKANARRRLPSWIAPQGLLRGVFRLTEWRQQTGMGWLAVLKAAQLAACCAAVLELPDVFVHGAIPPERAWFDFQHLDPVVDVSEPTHICRRGTERHSDAMRGVQLPAPCNAKRLRALAYRAAFRYSGIAPERCPAGEDDVAVAHVRTLDMDETKSVHSTYGQPPLSYYLGAWTHSGKRRLRVLYKSAAPANRSRARRNALNALKGDAGNLINVGESPVVQALQMLRSSLGLQIEFQSSADFASDLRTLLCASTLITSRTSLNYILLAGPHLRRAYQHEGASAFEGHAPMPFDCSLPRFVHAAEKGSHTGWRATDRQKLGMVLAANSSFRRMNASNAAWCSCGDVSNVVDWGRGGRGDIGSGSCSLRDGRLLVKTSSPPEWRDAANTR